MNIEKEILQVNVEDIIPNRFQPRLTFDESSLNELASSIKEHGIIQPLVLRKIGDKFEIIAGERRYKASLIAGLTNVPAIITDLDDNNSAEIAVVENLQRKNLSCVEEAKSYKKLLDKGYLTQEQLGKRMGITQSTIANKLRLLNLPEEVQLALLEGKISERHARSILTIEGKQNKIDLLNKILFKRLTVKQTDDLIKRMRKINNNSSIMDEDNDSGISKEKKQENIFDVKSEQMIANTKDIIESQKKVDFESLLKKQDQSTSSENSLFEEKIDLEEEPTNMNMGNIFEESSQPINPFQQNSTNDIETEILDLGEKKSDIIVEEKFNIRDIEKKEEPYDSIIAEFKHQKQEDIEETHKEQEIPKKGLGGAINASREVVENIKEMGLNVEKEEFDFEDVYQIIIKIKK